jgi:hypothetical protein
MIRTLHALATKQHTSCGISDTLISSSSQGAPLFCVFVICTTTWFKASNVIVGWFHRTTLICECLPPYWIFCSGLHTHGPYSNQKLHTASRSPKAPQTFFMISVGMSQITTIILRLLKHIFFVKINRGWNACELAVPLVNSVKGASHVDELFKKFNLSNVTKAKVVVEVTVTFSWN